MTGSRWTPDELEVLRSRYGRASTADIARALGRSVPSVHTAAVRYGLGKRRQPPPKALLELIAERHAEGWMDGEIMHAWNAANPRQSVERRTVGNYRRRLGLPGNAHNDRHRQQVARRLQSQLQRTGAVSLAELASRRFRLRVAAQGWPAGIRITPSELRVLEFMADGQPHTRREIAAELGHGNARHDLKTREPGQSLTASLVRKGLLRRTRGRIRKRRGKGRSEYEYYIPLQVLQRRREKNGRRFRR